MTLYARLGQAAFLTLRLVDLLDPRRREPVTPDAFGYQCEATARFVAELKGEGFEAPYLVSLVEDVRGAFERRESWRVWTSLCCLSINLRDRERWDEASDVLETAWPLVDHRWPEEETLSVALQLGEHAARTGRAADAERLYSAAARRVGAGGKRALRLARAALVLAQDPGRAEQRYRRLLQEVVRARDCGAEAHAELGLARALLAQGRATEATLRAWRAYELAEHAVDSCDARLAVGAALESLGALRSAAQAYWSPALGHPRPTVRWSALAGLVRVLARMGDRVGFERWRRFGERLLGDMPSPSFEVEFVVEVVRGLGRLGAREAARRVLSDARAHLRDRESPRTASWLLRVEEELASPMRESDRVEAAELPPDVRAVAQNVSKFGDPAPPPER